MVQFRKSKKVGPFRNTASKKGLGVSAGVGPVRISRSADGKVRRTITAPGTGIYDTKVIGGGQKSQKPSPPPRSPANGTAPEAPHDRIAGYEAEMASPFRCGPVSLPTSMTVKGYNGTITFDGSTIQLNRKGLTAKLGGITDTSFPITAVNHIEWKEPTLAVNGHLHFNIPLLDGTRRSPVPIPQNPHLTTVSAAAGRWAFHSGRSI